MVKILFLLAVSVFGIKATLVFFLGCSLVALMLFAMLAAALTGAGGFMFPEEERPC